MAESLAGHLGEAASREIMEGSGAIETLDERGRAAWMKSVIDDIDRQVPDEETRISIMTDCSCRCYEEHIEAFRDEYRRSKDIDRLLDLMYGKVFLLRPVREGNTVYVTKAPRFPEQHRKAKTAREKAYFFCHCDYVRAVSERISLTYCYCGAGWCKRIWEGALGRTVRVDIDKSVLQGDDVCRFAVHI
jgi:hypothetical protein